MNTLVSNCCGSPTKLVFTDTFGKEQSAFSGKAGFVLHICKKCNQKCVAVIKGDEKIRLIRFQPVGLNSVLLTPEQMKDFVDMLSVGDKVEITVLEMTKNQYDKLSEFDGF